MPERCTYNLDICLFISIHSSEETFTFISKVLQDCPRDVLAEHCPWLQGSLLSAQPHLTPQTEAAKGRCSHPQLTSTVYMCSFISVLFHLNELLI